MKYYGTVQATEGCPTISVILDDEIAENFKKTFSCSNGENPGELTIGATPKNFIHLASFMERYPLSGPGSGLIHHFANRHHERAHDFQKILDKELPTGNIHLLVPTREYQSLAASIFHRTKALLLGDTVGLGKTVTAIAALSNPALHPAIYVTQTHLPRQVQESFRKFAPKLRTHIVTSGTKYDLTTIRMQSGFPLPDVVLISYSKLPGWCAYLASFAKTVIWDEVQELRRSTSSRYRAAMVLSDAVEYRMGMSATPIYNYGGEIFSVMEAIAPGELGSWDDFYEDWCNGGKAKPQLANPQDFGKHLRQTGFFLRRTREDVGRELPPCSYVLQPVSSNHKELAKITENCTDLAKALLKTTGSGFDKLRATQEFNMKLRLATGLDKAPFVAEFVRMLIESGEKVVLFGWHHDVYEIWKAKFKDVKYRTYTGIESISQKEAAKKDFISGEAQLLILSLRSGSGVDGLQDCCNICVFGEFDWSPGVQEQAIGRVWRDGQTKPVTAYYMISDEGSDPYMAEVLDLKTLQSTGIRDPERDISGELFQNLQVDPNRIKELARRFLLANPDKLGSGDIAALDMTPHTRVKNNGSLGFSAIAHQDTSAIDRQRALYFGEERPAATDSH